jgi:hypothetical protein
MAAPEHRLDDTTTEKSNDAALSVVLKVVPDKIIEWAPAGMPGPLYVNSAKPELGSPPVIDIVLQVPRVAPLE